VKVYHRHLVCNRLEKKSFEHKILLHSNIEDQRAQQCHNKSFIITRLFSPCESFNCGLPGIRRNIDGKGRTVCYKPRNLKHRGITRKPERLLKLYSRELSSTIDLYKNGENAFIYSKQQQQRNQDTALKSLRLHGF
jgi:hypothetical protein